MSGKFFGGSIRAVQIVEKKSAHQMALGKVPGGPLQPHFWAQSLEAFCGKAWGPLQDSPGFVLKVSEESIRCCLGMTDSRACVFSSFLILQDVVSPVVASRHKIQYQYSRVTWHKAGRSFMWQAPGT